jgi:hypothetical protein
MNFQRERISCSHEAAVHTKWLDDRSLMEAVKSGLSRKSSPYPPFFYSPFYPATLYQADS